MIMDKDLAGSLVILGLDGDIWLGNGRTQEFQQSKFTRRMEQGQIQVVTEYREVTGGAGDGT